MDNILAIISSHTDFCVINQLSKNYNFNLYVIFDVNFAGDRFPNEQKLLKFKKMWNYSDEISINHQSPNLDYLENFEKKYNINLWKVAYGERSFYKYNLYHKFDRKEILSIVEKECRLFEKILELCNPNFVVGGQISSHHNYLLTEMVKTKGGKILNVEPVGLGYLSRITINEESIKVEKFSKDYDKIDLKKFFQKFNYPEQVKKFVQEQEKVERFDQLSYLLKFLISPNKDRTKVYTHFGKTRLNILNKIRSLSSRRRKITNYVQKHSVRKVEDYKPFVYFPLHSEPEKALLLDAPYYSNQIEVIHNIAKSLPVAFTLLVKDHLVTKILGRSVAFYEQIVNLPNVKLLDSTVGRDEILKNCSLVITIGGSSGLEAAFFNKPSIILGDTHYSSLPSVIRLKSIEEISKSIKSALKLNVDKMELQKFVSSLLFDSFEFDSMYLKTDVLNRFFSKGFFLEPKGTSEEEIKSFIQKHQKIIDLIALEYLKKIKFCKSSYP